jgi:microcin C transport system ATP-binding protein
VSLLEIADLGVHFQLEESVVEAVRKVDLRIEAGETVALVGESGSGKSVTAMSVLQLLPYPKARHPHGSIRFDGHELIGADKTVLRDLRGNRIAMIFQEPMSSLNPLQTIERQVGETLILHQGMSRSRARRRTLELLELVRLPEAAGRLRAFPHQLSGGQRQRVMIAMALANEPDLLIADEPTTALDVTIQAEILELLMDLQARFGMAIMLITHDLTIVEHIADRIYVMTRGEVVEQGETAEVFRAPQHPYTRTLLSSTPQGEPPPIAADADLVMQAETLKVWFPIQRGVLRRTVDHVKAVDGVSITMRAGQTLGVVGESGSGKTTLGLALLRLISSRGSIRFNGIEIQQLRSRQLRPLRREMQIVFQDPFSSLSPRLTAFQIIEEGLLVHQREHTFDERRQLVARALAEVGIDPETMDRFPHEFSGGQRQRIAIARAMALNPELVVLDEPTSSLDLTIQSQIIELLRDLQRRHQIAYLFISHDLRVVRALANEILVMKEGRVVESGPSEEIFQRPRHDYTRALMAAAFNVATSDGPG